MLTLREAAAILRLSVRTLRQETWRTKLGIVAVGHKLLVPAYRVHATLRGE